MWLFKKRFTDEQKGKLQQVAEILNCLAKDQETAYSTMLVEMGGFLKNCVDGQNAGLGRPLNSPRDYEIEMVRGMLWSHRGAVETSISRLEEMFIPNWAPSKFTETRQEWSKFWEAHVSFIDTALEGLEPPNPLIDQVGKAKLNMLISGLSLAQKLVQHNRLKA